MSRCYAYGTIMSSAHALTVGRLALQNTGQEGEGVPIRPESAATAQPPNAGGGAAAPYTVRGARSAAPPCLSCPSWNLPKLTNPTKQRPSSLTRLLRRARMVSSWWSGRQKLTSRSDHAGSARRDVDAGTPANCMLRKHVRS